MNIIHISFKTCIWLNTKEDIFTNVLVSIQWKSIWIFKISSFIRKEVIGDWNDIRVKKEFTQKTYPKSKKSLYRLGCKLISSITHINHFKKKARFHLQVPLISVFQIFYRWFQQQQQTLHGPNLTSGKSLQRINNLSSFNAT